LANGFSMGSVPRKPNPNSRGFDGSNSVRPQLEQEARDL